MSKIINSGKTEKDILKYAKQYLRMIGWYVVRIQQGIGCHPGISDLIAIKDGVVVFLEIKSPKWKPRSYDAASKTQREQEAFEAAVLQHGATYVRVQSFEEIEEIGRLVG